MWLIRPLIINNIILYETNIAEADYAAYNAGTAYALGDRVLYVSPSATFTVTIATPAVFTWAAHNLANDTPIMFSTTGALPTGLDTATLYYVRNKTTNTFQVSTKKGGGVVSTSGTQSGTHTATAQVHKVFESLQAANTGNYPLISPTWWIEVGSTNRWAMFDGAVSSQTTNADEIKVTLNTVGRDDAVSLFNVSGCATTRFTMSDRTAQQTFTVTIATPAVVTCTAHGFINSDDITFQTTGALPTGLAQNTVYYVVNKTDDTFEVSLTSGGASINTTGTQSGVHSVLEVVYDDNYNMTSDSGINDWWMYYFEPIVRKTEITEIEMPPYVGAAVTVTMTGTGETVGCGACVVGQKIDVGFTQHGASIGIKDYSVKTQDDFGNYSITERSYSKRATFTIYIEGGATDNLQNTLAQYRSTPIVYIGSTDYASTQIYGFYRDFSINIAYPTMSICDLEVESLI